MRACIVTGCDRVPNSGSGDAPCPMHYERMRRTGSYGPAERDPRNWGGGKPMLEHPSYPTIHRRLLRQLGSAKDHQCAWGDEQAHEWAYTHDDPNEKVVVYRGKRLRYSEEGRFYIPLCRSHHRQFDADTAAQERFDRGEEHPRTAAARIRRLTAQESSEA